MDKAMLPLKQRYQKLLDDLVPFPLPRWLAVCGICSYFMYRIVALQGWYISGYALAIFHLNLFIAFLSPKIDPSFEMAESLDEDNGPELPRNNDEEFRPFIRRLPEFKFWEQVMISSILATFTTFFECFNVPVFWPILVMYFFILFFLTMKRQIKHMIKYKYIPFTHGKTKYKGSKIVSEPVASIPMMPMDKSPKINPVEPTELLLPTDMLS